MISITNSSPLPLEGPAAANQGCIFTRSNAELVRFPGMRLDNEGRGRS